jgi:uncharacterized protein (TIGR02466 family)
MKIHPLFPTPLLESVLPGSEQLCAQLRDAILRRKATSDGVRHSNLTGWQSSHDFPQWSGQPGQILMAAVQEVADRFTSVMMDGQLQRTTLDWKISAWANVNRKGDANALHYHPGCYWSAVFYVDDGGIDGREDMGGAIEFVDPRGALPLMYAPTVKMAVSQCTTAGLGEQIFPRTGLLVMFPSWLGHRVTAYHGDGERISVAINFSV